MDKTKLKVCCRCGEEKELSQFCKRGNPCKKCISDYNSKYFSNNKERIVSSRAPYLANYYLQHKSEICHARVNYRITHKKEINSYKSTYFKQRRKNDPLFRLKRQLHSLLGNSFRNRKYKKRFKTYFLIGLDYELLKNHLEYTWFRNYGTEYCGQRVEIDHVIPCSSAKTEEDLIRLHHWTNLQYLTPEDNLKKGNRH